ncbi:hypothetical protein QVD17_21227 [Tagetes erecta]|uniref:Uncharacterized protein n=1 Tax=Tagetes erecta TaxID=13708 RepID=A0AAD8NRR1_TARER|nr:hypothetical protein QVD17_21227 [Tagetes erecta]
MEINQTLISSSVHHDDDANRDPEDSVISVHNHQSPADKLSFGFNHLISQHETSIDCDMELNQPTVSSSSAAAVFTVADDDDVDLHRDPDGPVHQSASDDVTLGFNHLQIDHNDDKNLMQETDELAADEVSFGFNHLQIETDENEDEDVDADDDDDDGDFTFACVNDNINDLINSPSADDSFKTGQIRNVFPLFDQSLLSNSDLPIEVPVDNVFIESPQQSPFNNVKTDSTIRELSKQSEIKSNTSDINIKSNSTGFSKLWRFRNEMNRSNSDGRDAFVFLETPTTSSSGTKLNAVKGKGVKKVKKSTASAHEVYMKQKGQSEEDRRRSYLPYRPGLMGFFTNVNGGLSKNVHPF